jgi:beta-galactosidase/beta-glucuronidase
MRKKLLFTVLLPLSTFTASAQVSFGKPEKINDGWSFIFSSAQAAPAATEKGWYPVNLPHDWSVKAPLSPTLASCTGYLPGGTGWYSKAIVIPEARKNEKVYLYFEGVYNRSEVFVNGHSLGVRPNGYSSFMYDATPHVEFGRENAIAVRVDHSRSADSRWYTGSGIYRDVWLVYANPVHIAQWGVYAVPQTATAKLGELSVEVALENGSPESAPITVVNELVDAAGKSVAKSSSKVALAAAQMSGKVTAKLSVKNPKLWSLEAPNLYTLKTTVLLGGKVIDETSTTTGFRSLRFDPDRGFALNGQWLKVKGVCLHHDAGVLGAAVPPEVWRKRLLTLKEVGCNAIRTSHNPQAPALYDLCDELGLLVLDESADEWEFPKRKWIAGWNVGTPGFDGSFDFFEDWGARDLADMVRRDRNHPSIFAWSIVNEVDYPNDPYSHPVLDGKDASGFTQPIFGGYKPDAPNAERLGAIAKRMVATVKDYDQSRPVTAGLAGVAMSNQTAFPAALDITGYNYTESRYAEDHKAYPQRVIFGSENSHSIDAWRAVTGNEHIFGQFLWTGIDYLGESYAWPSRGFHSGLLDFGGFIKPRGYFRQSLWSSKPMAYLGAYPAPRSADRAPSVDAWPVWNYEEGQLIRVVCYTNAPKALLRLNGEPVGSPKDYDPKTGVIVWDIPFEAGTLEVTGLSKDGEEVARYAIRTSGRPYAIEVVAADTVVYGKGLAQVTLQVVDEHGVPVMLSDDEITCRVAGGLKLLGMEASNNADMGDYTDNAQRAFHGKLLAYLQATGSEESVAEVEFSAPWLKKATLSITCNNRVSIFLK